jgi:putative ABC transport system permease protein
MNLSAAVENAFHRLNPDLPVSDIDTLEARTRGASGIQRIAASTVSVFGFLALLLASVGIYGVVSYTTKQRTREIGIRVALGASSRDIVRLVIGQAARLTLVGLGIGLGASLLTTKLLSSFLFGVSANDPFTFAGVCFLLGAVALVACYLPARMATRGDPMLALRYE